MFPGHESDFFRNRLTHSLEVAQIAKSIANKLNAEHEYFSRRKIDTDLVEFAALAHDLGHPPFGHNGEEALDECMAEAGGFEGNAQTLRILTRLEKRAMTNGGASNADRVEAGQDNRAGLNLTYRSLAAILKYDKQIPRQRRDREDARGPVKGYYYTEAPIVQAIRDNLSSIDGKPLRTIECSIMDIADDIAYSTYDLEDAFKGRFLTPASLLATDESIARSVCRTIEERARRYYTGLSPEELSFDLDAFYQTVLGIFAGVFESGVDLASLFDDHPDDNSSRLAAFATITSVASTVSDQLAGDGYIRVAFTSELIKRALGEIEVVFNEREPHLSVARLPISTFREVETLKNIVFQTLILSPMLKVSAHRGQDIVKKIFYALTASGGHNLMPSDFQLMYLNLKEPDEKKRVVCDFIAGMTDRYAVQFYSRLFGTHPETIHSPL